QMELRTRHRTADPATIKRLRQRRSGKLGRTGANGSVASTGTGRGSLLGRLERFRSRDRDRSLARVSAMASRRNQDLLAGIAGVPDDCVLQFELKVLETSVGIECSAVVILERVF